MKKLLFLLAVIALFAQPEGKKKNYRKKAP